MNGLSSGLAALLAVLAAAPGAVAQTQPSSGTLHPPVAAESAATAAPAKRLAPAPRAAVQQVAPFAAPMPPPKPVPGHTAPARPAKPAAAAAPAPVVAASPTPPAEKGTEPPPAAAKAAATASLPKTGLTGLPLPRWASLRADEVNLRSGPGTRYPIEWVYHRRDLPVQIEREFEGWRLIEDPDGVKGWVHQATLVGRRSFVVKGAERVLRRSASEDAAAVARLKPGVVGRIRACEPNANWCEVQAGEYRGFLRREEFYGIYPGEAIN